MCSLWIVYYKDKFIIAIKFVFIIIAVFRFILNKLPLNDIKYTNYVTWKGVYTHRNSICSLLQFFFIITCSFSVFVENCILLPKGINEFVVFLCIVYVWFWFVTLLPRFLLLVINGQFFSQNKNSVSECIFFSFTKM